MLKMKTIVTISLALLSAIIIAGSKLEATVGQNIILTFDIDEVEKADLVMITFKQDNHEQPAVIAQQPWTYDETPPPEVKLLIEEGRVSVTIQNVNISRSGLYKAQAFFGNKVSELKATLVVIEASFSSTITPPHSFTPKLLNNSSQLLWLCALIPLIISGGCLLL